MVLSPERYKALAAAAEREETLQAIEEGMRQCDAGLGIPWAQAKKEIRKRLKLRTAAKSKSTR